MIIIIIVSLIYRLTVTRTDITQNDRLDCMKWCENCNGEQFLFLKVLN